MSDKYIPLILSDGNNELCRFNYDGTWTISDWEAIRAYAAQKLNFENGTKVGIARLLMSARGNFYETPMAKAEEIAVEAGQKYKDYMNESLMVDEFLDMISYC